MNCRHYLLFSLLMLSALIVSLGCKSRKDTGNPVVSDTLKADTSRCTALDMNPKPEKSDPLASMTVSVSGDCLELKVTFGGGCEKHDFSLHWSGAWEKSYPPQATLFLAHDAHDDRCRAMLTEKLTFDLTPLRVKNVGQVIINVQTEGAFARGNYTYTPER